MPPILIVPIAPSGSGKSTLYTSLKDVNPALYHFSWDLLRLKYYSPDYGIAWLMYQRDPTFFSRAAEEFHQAVVRRNDIYVDNMNLSVGSRHQFTTTAKKFGYVRIAYYLDVSFDELFRRHSHMRAKNKVKLSAYENMKQLREQQPPVDGEFDVVIYMKWNGLENRYIVERIA